MTSPESGKKITSSSTPTTSYKRGDRVEITSTDEGFMGSYYTANIIAWLVDDDYIVQYKTLVKEDGSGLLREVVSGHQIQPAPAEIPVSRFLIGDVVDAYDKDGWWAGKISGKKGSKYIVYFEDADEKTAYPISLLRVHQDWVDGCWVSPTKIVM